MRRSTLFSLIALAFVSACSREISGPGIRPVGRGVVSRLTSFDGTPNSHKYHDTGLHPATGRAGSATLEARALLGMDGNTFVEASTGSLEDGTHSGQIAKVQLNTGATTTNFNGLSNSGYWSASVTGLSPGQPLKVQTNIRGIDPKRTDVITVTPTVGRRPDIAVTQVGTANSAPPNTPITIAATVSELNGDFGARADCVLSINGSDVDQATGIWVDAAGSVSCLFSHSFASVGTYDIRVTAANVVPTDWDTANNSAATSISILSPGGTITQGYLSLGDYHYGYDSFTRYSTVEGFAYDNGTTYRYDYSSVWASAWESRASPLPTQRMEVDLGVNGTSVSTEVALPSYTDTYDDGYSYKYGCTYLRTSDGGRWGQACSYEFYGNSAPYSYYYFSNATGTITYYGYNTYCDQLHQCNTYTWNSDNAYGGGNAIGWTQGSIANVKVAYVDADGVRHTIDENVAINDRGEVGPWNDYTSCWSDAWYTSYCYGYVNYNGFYTYANFSWYHP